MLSFKPHYIYLFLHVHVNSFFVLGSHPERFNFHCFQGDSFSTGGKCPPTTTDNQHIKLIMALVWLSLSCSVLL